LKDELKIDDHKLNYHPDRVSSWMKGENIYPIYIELGISSICNHRCIFCALDYIGYKGKLLDTKVILDAIDDMSKNGVKSIMFSGEGEPTLHKDFSLIVEYAKKKKKIDVALTTNGIPFKKKIAESTLQYLSWVKFSIDAGTKETYVKIHRTDPNDFEKLMINIKDAVELKKKKKMSVKIGTQLLLIEENMHEAIILAKKMKEVGADYLIIKPYSQHPDSLHKFKIDYEKFKDIQKLEELNSDSFNVYLRSETINKLKGRKNPYDVCHGLPFFCIIDAEGNVVPCHIFHGKKEYYYGNLYKNTFSEIWNSERRKKVLERIYKEGTVNCRENCRLDSINRYLHSLKNPIEHVNFI